MSVGRPEVLPLGRRPPPAGPSLQQLGEAPPPHPAGEKAGTLWNAYLSLIREITGVQNRILTPAAQDVLAGNLKTTAQAPPKRSQAKNILESQD